MVGIEEIIEYTLEQRSPEWFAVRCGKLTGSVVADIMPAIKARVKWTQAQEKVLFKVAAEILTGQSEPPCYINAAMQWGIDHEDEARRAVEIKLGCTTRECGIFQRGDYVAASPDAITGNNERPLELKCPNSATHLSYLLDPESFWKKYKWQVLGETYCTGLDVGILASYDPRFIDEGKQLLIYTPVDYTDDLKRLEDRLGEVAEKIKELIK